MDDEVMVKVTITERVRYSAFVNMPRSKFEELDTALDEERGHELRRVEERIGEFCDRKDDWQDAENIEIEEFHVMVEPDDA